MYRVVEDSFDHIDIVDARDDTHVAAAVDTFKRIDLVRPENIRLAAQPEFEALQEKMKALQEERKALADRVRSEVDVVLTDEQRSKLEEGRAGRDGRRDHKPGKGDRDEKDPASRSNN